MTSHSIDANSAAGKTQTVVNLSYVSFLLGIPFSLGLAKLYLQSVSSSALDTPWFRESLVIYGIAAIGELLTEPCFVVAQQKMLYRLRAKAESGATLARCLVTCGVAVWGSSIHGSGGDSLVLGVLPFALGQLAYTLVLAIIYFRETSALARQGGFSVLAQPMLERYTILYHHMSPIATMLLKHLRYILPDRTFTDRRRLVSASYLETSLITISIYCAISPIAFFP